MKTGIIGLPQVGKTSLFVMLTKQQVAQRSRQSARGASGRHQGSRRPARPAGRAVQPEEADPRQRGVCRRGGAEQRGAERDRLRRQPAQRRRAGARGARLRGRLHSARRADRSAARHQEHRLRPDRQRPGPGGEAAGAGRERPEEDEVGGDRARVRAAETRQGAP